MLIFIKVFITHFEVFVFDEKSFTAPSTLYFCFVLMPFIYKDFTIV